MSSCPTHEMNSLYALRTSYFSLSTVWPKAESYERWTMNTSNLYTVHHTNGIHTMRKREANGDTRFAVCSSLRCCRLLISHHITHRLQCFLQHSIQHVCNTICTPNTNTWTEWVIVKNFQHPNSHNTIYGGAYNSNNTRYDQRNCWNILCVLVDWNSVVHK